MAQIVSEVSETSQPPLADDVAREVETLLAVEPRVSFAEAPHMARITSADVWTMRGLIALGVVTVAAFFWFVLIDAEMGSPILFWPLVIFFGFGAVLTLYEWFCYLGVKPTGTIPAAKPGRTVDVLTTWCPGEPKDMVVATLKTILAMRYPHTTYLCDEGDDPALREICRRWGIVHVTREEKVGAKAGNINNALRQATGEITVIMDPDHETAPYFLDQVVGFFDDPKIGFVQHVQAYYNQDESLVALGAAEQTYHFYGPVQTGMHGHLTTQAIGANCAFRREALDSIGGHAHGLAEDMATTLKLYAKGWTSVYSPQLLSRGQVPGTYAAYCKQQLKWACGVWDILIESYPAAFRTISWRNRLHYLMNGFFYLRGFVVLIGALIPIIALLTGLTPVEITLEQFLLWFGPMLALQILIKQAAQRWLLERHEYGLHFAGGFLMNSVWLIHLRGLISSLFRVKIPYIPTPKDDAAANAWSLAMPNFLLVAASIGAIAYGLWWDWSPYAGLMAFFALMNVISLGTIAVAAQQKFLQPLTRSGGPVAAVGAVLGRISKGVQDALCWSLRKAAAPLAALVLVGGAVAHMPDGEETQLETLWAQIEGRTEKERGGLMLGAYYRDMDEAAVGNSAVDAALGKVGSLESALGADMSIVSLFYVWNDQFDDGFPSDTLNAIHARGSVPMVTWMPTLNSFEKAKTDPRYYNEERVFELILSGEFDDFLDRTARRYRDLDGPVLMRFAHEMDNPQYPWSMAGGNTPEQFQQAWRHVVDRFRAQGAENVLWVWSPWSEGTLQQYYPGDPYVDYVGLTLLNYGSSQGFGEWHSFADLYQPFRDKTHQYPAPVLLAEFGSTDLGGDREAWLEDALADIAQREEIAGAVFFNSDADKNWPAQWADAPEQFPIVWDMGAGAEQLGSTTASLSEGDKLMARLTPTAPIRSQKAATRWLARTDAGYSLMVEGKPFQMRGVAYGAGQGWRAGALPTRRQVEQDFAGMAEMGANTVRIYGLDWSNRNVLNAAEEHGLKVMMGAWLEPEIDYVADTELLQEMEDEVLAAVDYWKDEPAVLGWNIGNETWGQLKHHYAGPMLVRQRAAYVAFVERLAGKVKAIDDTHPVFTSLEYSRATTGAIAEFDRNAPSVDAIGINAYYPRHLDWLWFTLDTMNVGTPVFLSEFGPQGYWDAEETDWTDDGMPLEPSDAVKAKQYVKAWSLHVEHRRNAIGAIAFSWADRFEGSPTWFGLTDSDGRKKPAYFALSSYWTGIAAPNTGLPRDLAITLEGAARPGKTVQVRLTGTDWIKGCDLEFELVDEMTMESVWQHPGETCAPNRPTAIRLPTEAGRYRLIAKASRAQAVTSASYPVYLQ